MGNSTLSLASAFDIVASAKGIPDPRNTASGYAEDLALECGNNAMADLIAERFNWKFNRKSAVPFLTNSWQQDYPQPAQPSGKPIGWGEDCDMIDINNTVIPKPLWNLKWRRGLSRMNQNVWRVQNLCWMYNKDLTIGTWPGANITYYPLLGVNAPQGQNPLMSMTDKNGNILIVTGFGTTGSTAPFVAADAAEGATVTDGTVTWSKVLPTSQGFRLDALPSSTGPTYQILPYYQEDPPLFTDLQQKLDPIPDSFRRHFLRCLEEECQIAAAGPGDRQKMEDAKIARLNALAMAMKQGDRELNIYSLLPATSPVQERWEECRPFTADNPY